MTIDYEDREVTATSTTPFLLLLPPSRPTPKPIIIDRLGKLLTLSGRAPLDTPRVPRLSLLVERRSQTQREYTRARSRQRRRLALMIALVFALGTSLGILIALKMDFVRATVTSIGR